MIFGSNLLIKSWSFMYLRVASNDFFIISSFDDPDVRWLKGDDVNDDLSWSTDLLPLVPLLNEHPIWAPFVILSQYSLNPWFKSIFADLNSASVGRLRIFISSFDHFLNSTSGFVTKRVNSFTSLNFGSGVDGSCPLFLTRPSSVASECLAAHDSWWLKCWRPFLPFRLLLFRVEEPALPALIWWCDDDVCWGDEKQAADAGLLSWIYILWSDDNNDCVNIWGMIYNMYGWFIKQSVDHSYQVMIGWILWTDNYLFDNSWGWWEWLSHPTVNVTI